MTAERVLVLEVPRTIWVSGLAFAAACVVLSVVIWHPAPLAVAGFGLIVASFPLLAHLDAVKLDGPHLSVRRFVRWVGPIDLRDLVAFAYRPPSLRTPAVWLLIQRDAGSRIRWEGRLAVAPETRSLLHGRRDLRVVEVATGGGLSKLPGLADHLARYVLPSDAFVDPRAAWSSSAFEADAMVSEKYTHGHPASVLRSHGWRTAENSAAYLLPHLHPGLKVLDVGCGPGTITIDLARIVGAGHVVGLDGAASVIEAARESAATAEVDVVFAVGDAYALSYEDDRFDVVHAHQLLQHLADPVAALREMGRVCRPGGTVAVRDADYAAMSWWPLDPRLDRWRELYRAAARSNGGEPDAGRRLIEWARMAGFADLRPSASVWCFADPESRAWWAETWAERSTDSPLSEQLVRDGLALQSELDGIGDAWLEWSRDVDGWFAVVHGELLATVSTE